MIKHCIWLLYISCENWLWFPPRMHACLHESPNSKELSKLTNRLVSHKGTTRFSCSLHLAFLLKVLSLQLKCILKNTPYHISAKSCKTYTFRTGPMSKTTSNNRKGIHFSPFHSLVVRNEGILQYPRSSTMLVTTIGLVPFDKKMEERWYESLTYGKKQQLLYEASLHWDRL